MAPLKFIAIGNPLLDISAEVPLDFLLEKGLKPNDAIMVNDSTISDEIERRFTAQYIPGGAAQNVVRVTQGLMGQDSVCGYIGSIGVDRRGDEMIRLLNDSKVEPLYYRTPDKDTGTCAVCVTGHNRSLAAALQAAQDFPLSHIVETVWNRIQEVYYVYSTGFFLTVNAAALCKVAQHMAEQGKVFLMNISAEFVLQVCKQGFLDVLPHVDYLFGNETEFRRLGKELKYPSDDLEEIVATACRHGKTNQRRKRVVVLTQGSLQTIVASGWGDQVKISKYPVVLLKPEEIVDTNAAGDAFVGGFVAALIREKSLDDCVMLGHFAARKIIGESGCSVRFDQGAWEECYRSA
eukprot:GHVU01120029.1.p1 GENE.GHVU01120029.1~~GHVU01120029.1.p1  ORF type:complete len:349 (+),score=35.47 GHVU01120029.1:66-1112(+)